MKKKWIYVMVALLAAFSLLTCDLLEPVDAERSNWLETDWTYEEQPDGSIHYTIYLDGTTVPTPAHMRALGKDLAKMSHDTFEAVFMHGTTVARANWQIGQRAGIRGVPRNEAGAGVAYGALNAFTGASAAAGVVNGSAIIFVGRNDGTLLGVGTLAWVNEPRPIVGSTPPGTDTPESYIVDVNSTSVTFKVTALKTKLDPDAAAATGTSFFHVPGTVANHPATFPTGQPNAYWTNIEGVPYPIYNIPIGVPAASGATPPFNPYYTITSAVYTVYGDNGTPTPVALEPTNHLGAMIVGRGGAAMARIPRYQIGGQYREVIMEWFLSIAANSTTSGIRLINNLGLGANDADNAFVPGIQFEIRIPDANDKSGIFALVFEIPVVALTTLPSTNSIPALSWFIRPGFGEPFWALDNGVDAGGMVLMGRDVTGIDWLEIYTKGIGIAD